MKSDKTKIMASRRMRMVFYSHRHTSGRRGIEFLMTYEEWFGVWWRSGRIAEMGRKRGQYCMSRPGDRGPYAVGNVRIVRQEENKSEYQRSPRGREVLAQLIEVSKTPSAITRAKISAAGRGRPKSPEFKAQISAAWKDGRIRPPPRGAANPNALLTELQVAAIRAERAEKKTAYKILGKKYGVSKSTIGNLITGVSYAEA